MILLGQRHASKRLNGVEPFGFTPKISQNDQTLGVWSVWSAAKPIEVRLQ